MICAWKDTLATIKIDEIHTWSSPFTNHCFSKYKSWVGGWAAAGGVENLTINFPWPNRAFLVFHF